MTAPAARDSRGLTFQVPDDDPGWTPGRHSAQPPESGEVHAETAPCVVCGHPAPLVLFRYATDLRYAVCPIQDLAACLERARAERRAVDALLAEPGEPGEPEAPPAKTAAKPRNRAPRARKAPAAKAATDSAAGAADPAPASAAAPEQQQGASREGGSGTGGED